MTVPQLRRAARVLLLDGRDRLLLLRWEHPGAPERGSWWITPGGGLDEEETAAEGAARELFEETGLAVAAGELGEPVLEREVDTEIAGIRYLQHEQFFLVRVDAHEVDTRGFSELETQAVTGYRWWTREELAATTERVSPANVLELLP